MYLAIISKGVDVMKTWEEFLKEYMKDYDVWNMSLEEYNFHKQQALKLYKKEISASQN